MSARPLAITVVVTVRNEARTINALLQALRAQTQPAAEVIIVDGGSQDQTLAVLTQFAADHPDFPLRFTTGNWNRSQGRNLGIRLSQNPLIAITDAGCLPAKNWLAALLAAYQQGLSTAAPGQPVVAGYAMGRAVSGWQAAVLPYLLVMPDRVRPDAYLPATRSMLLPRSVWAAVGGFDESLNTSEDFILARRLQAAGYPIVFAPQAVVQWSPPRRWWPVSRTFFTFAAADVRGGVWRRQVLALFGRYILGVGLVLSAAALSGLWALLVAGSGMTLYLLWAVAKNWRYAPRSWYWLLVLQLTADLMVMGGTLWGSLGRLALHWRRLFHP